MNLLIVEDDVAYGQTLSRRMHKQGFNVELVSSADEVLLAARRFEPKYILLDMKLGNQTSLPLIKPLRSLLPESSIVLLTGFASIATAVEAIRQGANDYLAKPVDTQSVVATLTGKKATVEVDESPLSSEQMEWEHINQVLKTNNGNVSETARQLGMHRRTLQRKLQKKPLLVKVEHYG
ncbi:response regulator transcription factor [Pseudoalteromonas sp. G4]|uniref:response regulator transcription factor n=1 Tax=Pseudoalteromonas sp. G4 TaxID=2992761 RepID=UPI00237E3B8D|nr:response regulator [Pseudoalteromonas sp. G4]MDE3270609.1 response regulator [Pseudoalteromonas sp. G4]